MIFGKFYLPCHHLWRFYHKLIRYMRACSSYECFLLRVRRLSSKLLKRIPCGTLEIVIQEVLWSIRGFCSAVWSIPLTNVIWHSDPRPTVILSRTDNFMILIPSLTITELWVVSMEHLQRVWLVNRERLPFRTPGSVPLFGTGLCPICWDQSPRTCLF